MAITSFYLLNMFPRMRTLSSSSNNQHPSPKPNMFPQMRTLHHHPTSNTHHPSQTCSLGCALYIITQQSSPITQQPNMFPQMRTLRHHPTINTQQPTAKHVPSDAHFTSSPNNQQPSPNSHERDSIDFSIKLAC